MKFKVFAAGSLFVWLLLPMAQAQVNVGLDGNVPFEFHIGNMVLPAGNYIVRPISGFSPSILTIQALDQTARMILFVCPSRTQAGSAQITRLVFNRYGSTYFLSEVWQGFGSVGLQLGLSKAERIMAREMARAARPHNTELASVVFNPVK
jgi:hypothetical protein